MIAVDLKIHLDTRQRKRMTQRDGLCGSLGRHDRRDARHRQNIALGVTTLSNKIERRWLHLDTPMRDCAPGGNLFAAHVHHPGLALIVKMRKSLVAGRQPESTAGKC